MMWTLPWWTDKPPVLLRLRSSSLMILLTVSFAVFTDIFLYSVIVPVVPFTLSEQIGVPEHRVQYWVSISLAVYAIALFAASPIWGYLADRNTNRRIPMLVGLVFLGGATLLLCLSTNLVMLIAARILQGLSSAMTWTVGLALVIDTVDPKHVGRATGWVSIALSMGTLVGPMLGGIVYGNSGSYEVFYMCFGLIALDIILRLAIIETKEAKRWTDSCVDPVSVEGSDVSMAEHKSPASESIDANSAERGRVTLTPNNTSPPKITTSSMLPFLRKPRLLAALWATLIEAVVMTSFDSTIPLFVSSTFGWDSIGAGLVFLPLVLPTFASPIAGALSDRYGPKWMATAGFLIVTPFLICLRFVEEDTLRHKIMLCGLLVGVGIGVTLVFSPVMVEISWAVEEDLDDDEPTAAPYALAYGLYNMAFSGGAILGPIMGGLIRERAGWATVGWTMGLISVVTAITQALWIGGSLTSRWQRKGTKV